MHVASSTSPANKSPDTTPALRCFSTNAFATGRPMDSLKSFSQQVGPLAASEVGRNHADLVVARNRLDPFNQERRRGQRDGPASEGIFERRLIVNLQRDDGVCSNCFEQGCDVTDCHGIIVLRPPVLARVAKIRDDRGDLLSPGILQCTDEEQEPAKLVVRGLDRPPVQTMHDINIASRDSLEWSDLVFAVLEIPLLVDGKHTAERLGDRRAQRIAALQCKQLQPTVGRRLQRNRCPDRQGHLASRALGRFHPCS